MRIYMKNSEKILNVGCGEDSFGTDFVDIIPRRKNVIKCNLDIDKIPFPTNYFDVVYARNIFEHLQNQGYALKEMFRVLKQKGKIIIITDNAAFVPTHIHILPKEIVTRSHYDNEGRFGYEKKDLHFSIFTPLHIVNHFERIGLKKIHYEYRWVNIKENHPFFWKLQKLLNKNKAIARLILPYIELEAQK
jgi:predicted SAM-dependent methyltransferase